MSYLFQLADSSLTDKGTQHTYIGVYEYLFYTCQTVCYQFHKLYEFHQKDILIDPLSLLRNITLV